VEAIAKGAAVWSIPAASGTLEERRFSAASDAFELGFSRSAHPKASTGAKAGLHSMRNAALEGPLFHVGVNSRNMSLGLVSVAPFGALSSFTRLPTAGAVGCILAPLRG
jgi:hypothetical protein